ncbi:MAG TPA: penicillin-binding protein [Desulfuromonadales bacterium]|nr:penicillin-binding protein [Desulfuromonadales bacterium]
MDKQEKWIRLRIRLVGLLFVIVFALIVSRAFCLQVLNQQKWEKRAERQYQHVIPLAAKRGTIFDCNGEEMALSLQVDSVYVDPQQVTDGGHEAKSLAASLKLSVATVKKRLDANRSFVWIKRLVSPQESKKVRTLDLPGVHFIKEHKRYYPNGSIGAQVIGFTGLDPKGLEGIEHQYNSLILGQGGYLVTERDALGRGLGVGNQVIQGRSEGDNVYLTLDKNLQYIAEKELASGVSAVHARGGTVVMLDPQTGKVLAMASQPDYNPNALSKYTPRDWRNRAVCDTYEPGSTFKIFLMSSALDAGVVHTGETFNCENGAYAIGGKIIHDHEKFGQLTITQILKYSSNIGAAKIGALLGRERFYRYIRDFGFGSRTGIDLPGEVDGLLRKPSDWFDVDLATISFGQGISVTPIQLATAAAAVANGGSLMRPYVVERVEAPSGAVVYKADPKVVRHVVSEAATGKVRAMMIQAVEDGGTGTLAKVPGYEVGGKTGTAQKIDPVTGAYSTEKIVASFVGFVPARNPRLVILVVVNEPEDRAYGGLAAAPIFSRIAAQSLRYLGVAPTQPRKEEKLPPAVEAKVFPVNNLKKESGKTPLMPDFTGMSYRQVLQTMGRTGLNLKLRGVGRVIEQSPAPGAPIAYGHPAWVRMAPPS